MWHFYVLIYVWIFVRYVKFIAWVSILRELVQFLINRTEAIGFSLSLMDGWDLREDNGEWYVSVTAKDPYQYKDGKIHFPDQPMIKI